LSQLHAVRHAEVPVSSQAIFADLVIFNQNLHHLAQLLRLKFAETVILRVKVSGVVTGNFAVTTTERRLSTFLIKKGTAIFVS
jgi:hypothetical protein